MEWKKSEIDIYIYFFLSTKKKSTKTDLFYLQTFHQAWFRPQIQLGWSSRCLSSLLNLLHGCGHIIICTDIWIKPNRKRVFLEILRDCIILLTIYQGTWSCYCCPSIYGLLLEPWYTHMYVYWYASEFVRPNLHSHTQLLPF